jgi:hypothetical protein
MFQDIVDTEKQETKIPFLFLMSTKTGGQNASSSYLRSILEDAGTHNLQIGYYNYDIMTDVVIKTQMFGTILLRRRPFEVEKPQIHETFNNTNRLSIKLPFEKKFIDIYEPLTYLEADEFFQMYPNERVLCSIRTYMYQRADRIMDEIQAALSNMSYAERIPYDTVIRNLDFVKET